MDFESADVLRAIIEHLAMDAVKHCNSDDIAMDRPIPVSIMKPRGYDALQKALGRASNASDLWCPREPVYDPKTSEIVLYNSQVAFRHIEFLRVFPRRWSSRTRSSEPQESQPFKATVSADGATSLSFSSGTGLSTGIS